jgi:hypothetical protein
MPQAPLSAQVIHLLTQQQYTGCLTQDYFLSNHLGCSSQIETWELFLKMIVPEPPRVGVVTDKKFKGSVLQ